MHVDLNCIARKFQCLSKLSSEANTSIAAHLATVPSVSNCSAIYNCCKTSYILEQIRSYRHLQAVNPTAMSISLNMIIKLNKLAFLNTYFILFKGLKSHLEIFQLILPLLVSAVCNPIDYRCQRLRNNHMAFSMSSSQKLQITIYNLAQMLKFITIKKVNTYFII